MQSVVLEARAAVAELVAPHAASWDREQAMDADLPAALGSRGFLVPSLPVQAGGRGLNAVATGAVHEVVGRHCGSTRNLLGVQAMVAHSVLRWAGPELREMYLKRLGSGTAVGAFALTEPGSGSDARAAATLAEREPGGGFRLTGEKAWISFATRASVFLVLARLDDESAVLLVDADTNGVEVTPTPDLLGLRASHVGAIRFDECEVPAGNLLAHGRLAFDAVATYALDIGRHSTAWGCAGAAAACLDEALDRAAARQQFGQPIGEHQLVARLLTRMSTAVESAHLHAMAAAVDRDSAARTAARRTLTAKYVAAECALQVATDAVQILGAHGVSSRAPVERHLRDANVTLMIEGTTEILQTQIAALRLVERAAERRRSARAQAAGSPADGSP